VSEVTDLTYGSDMRMGIVFVIPFGTDTWRDCLEFANRMMDLNKLRADFCAVHLCREDVWQASEHRNCPGIAIVGKYVFR
jgi:hypothetical protein